MRRASFAMPSLSRTCRRRGAGAPRSLPKNCVASELRQSFARRSTGVSRRRLRSRIRCPLLPRQQSRPPSHRFQVGTCSRAPATDGIGASASGSKALIRGRRAARASRMVSGVRAGQSTRPCNPIEVRRSSSSATAISFPGCWVRRRERRWSIGVSGTMYPAVQSVGSTSIARIGVSNTQGKPNNLESTSVGVQSARRHMRFN